MRWLTDRLIWPNVVVSLSFFTYRERDGGIRTTPGESLNRDVNQGPRRE